MEVSVYADCESNVNNTTGNNHWYLNSNENLRWAAALDFSNEDVSGFKFDTEFIGHSVHLSSI